MVLKWKEAEEINIPSKLDTSDLIKDKELYGLTFEEIKKYPPRKFIEKRERWCPEKNSQTIGYKNKIDKHLDKIPSKFLIKFLEENKLEKFDIKRLIKLMNAENYTEGTLQRHILNALVCKGIIKHEQVIWEDENGQQKFKMVYSFDERKKECPFLIKNKCEFDWRKATESKFFDAETTTNYIGYNPKEKLNGTENN